MPLFVICLFVRPVFIYMLNADMISSWMLSTISLVI